MQQSTNRLMAELFRCPSRRIEKHHLSPIFHSTCSGLKQFIERHTCLRISYSVLKPNGRPGSILLFVLNHTLSPSSPFIHRVMAFQLTTFLLKDSGSIISLLSSLTGLEPTPCQLRFPGSFFSLVFSHHDSRMLSVDNSSGITQRSRTSWCPALHLRFVPYK